MNILAFNPGHDGAIVYLKNGADLSLYIDGKLEESIADGTSIATISSPIVFGKRSHADDNNFTGELDDIRIYDRPLNSAEIQALYHVYDPQPPFVVDTTPDNGTSIGVSDNLTVRFSEGIDQSTLASAFTLTRDNGTSVGIDNLNFDNASSPFSLTIDPGADYTADNYTLRISTDLKDLSGNPLRQPFELKFTATNP